MAYMNQERKAKIAAALKAIPEIRDWKYSLKVDGHTTIKLTIRVANIDLLAVYRKGPQFSGNGADYKAITYAQVNVYHLDNAFEGGTLALMKKIKDALDLRSEPEADQNFDKSDIMTDYFHVGWYTEIRIGEWDTPFCDVVAAPKPAIGVAPKFKGEISDLKTKALPFLPLTYSTLTPGKKAAAMKKAMKFAALA